MKTNLRMLGLLLCVLSTCLHAATGQDLKQGAQNDQERRARSAEQIPAGTIVPVSLNTTLRSDKSRTGDGVTATVMQDVPLRTREILRAGSRVNGHIVEAITPGQGSDGSRISFQFDQVRFDGVAIPITANLRAVASRKAVLAAMPQLTSSEYPDFQVQIGGDQISYGGDGLVMVGSQVVGKYTRQGVLAYESQDIGTACHGALDDNDHPQAFWLFSVNACGAYGFSDLRVFHSGLEAPLGEITLDSTSKVLKLEKGGASLLLVNGSGPEDAQTRTRTSRVTGQ
jgi:hypothetical protein